MSPVTTTPLETGIIPALGFRGVTGGAAGDLTVTGIKAGQKIICVLNMLAAGANLASEFTATADNTINNTGGTSTATMVLLVIWGRNPQK